MPSATHQGRTTTQETVTPATATASAPASALLLPLIALCTAVTAANIYLAAPLLPLIAQDFGSTPSAVAWVASVAQFGYAAGLLVFAPLGDSVNRRRLVAVLSLVTAAALAAGGASAGAPAPPPAGPVAPPPAAAPPLPVPPGPQPA